MNLSKPLTPEIHNPRFISPPFFCLRPLFCSYHRNPYIIHKPMIIPNRKTHLRDPIVIITPEHAPFRDNKKVVEENKGFSREGSGQMSVLCGFGYYVQGFRCFPWMALNFHMVHNLNLDPSILQVVQSSAILPMVAKPLYGILSDAFYIGGAHRIPYISIGVVLQVISWGLLALIPVAGEALPALMACVLLSNLGAAITEVAKDALTAEYGRAHKIPALQSYAFMALAGGGIIGNLLGGIFLLKTHSRTMFSVFTTILCLQLAISLLTREVSLGLLRPSNPNNFKKKRILDGIGAQFSDLFSAIKPKTISRPLIWIVASISMVPILSGSIYCYQTQCLNLDPSIIGMSRVVSQLILLSTTVLYDRFWKMIPMRKLMNAVQILYAFSLLLDFVSVTQMNLKLNISNKVFALCFSGIAETLAQFKLLPFSVLLAASSPSGCEGSLISFFASVICLSSMVSGFWGVGFASMVGISRGDYSRLPLGIMIQAIAALVPLFWISHLPMSDSFGKKETNKAKSRRCRKTRRVGKVAIDFVYTYGRTREFDSSSI